MANEPLSDQHLSMCKILVTVLRVQMDRQDYSEALQRLIASHAEQKRVIEELGAEITRLDAIMCTSGRQK